MDTSAFIYNQQNIEKSKVYHEVMRNALNDVNFNGLSIHTISNFSNENSSIESNDDHSEIDDDSSTNGTITQTKNELLIIERADTESSPLNYLSIDGRDTFSESWYSGERNTITYQEIYNDHDDIIGSSYDSEFPNYTNIETINNGSDDNNYANIHKLSTTSKNNN